MAAPPSLGDVDTSAAEKGEARTDMALGEARVAPHRGRVPTAQYLRERRVPEYLASRRDLRSPQVPLKPQWPLHRAILEVDGCPKVATDTISRE